MSIQVGTRVIVHGPIAYGITGIIDQIDGSTVPYHMKFDTPCDGVGFGWFKEGELVEIEAAKEDDATRLKRLLRTAMELLERVQGSMHTVNSPNYLKWSQARQELKETVKELLGNEYPW